MPWRTDTHQGTIQPILRQSSWPLRGGRGELHWLPRRTVKKAEGDLQEIWKSTLKGRDQGSAQRRGRTHWQVRGKTKVTQGARNQGRVDGRLQERANSAVRRVPGSASTHLRADNRHWQTEDSTRRSLRGPGKEASATQRTEAQRSMQKPKGRI